MKKKCLLLLLSLLACAGYAQKAGNIWYFGQRAGLDFNTTPPTPLSDGELATLEGCSSIADPATGQLLFYTDGILVWDRTHNVMPGCVGNPLNGNPSSTQSGVIVPKPGSSTQYYIFTTPAHAGNYGAPAMCYSLVDLNLNGGNGDLVSVNNVIMDTSAEKIAVVGNCAGTVYWIVGHRWNCDTFYAFRLTDAGLSAPVKSKTGIVHTDNGDGSAMAAIGYMKFSADSRKLGVVTYLKLNTVEIFDFDFSTGRVSNPVKDSMGINPDDDQEGPYGCSFSPDNSKFYVSYMAHESKVFQYDMQAGSPAAILGSKTVIGTLPPGKNLGALQNGPDGKLYLAVSGSSTLPVIAQPNAAGLACDFIWPGLNVGTGISSFGLPVIVESFLSEPGPSFNIPLSNKVCNGDTLLAPQYNHPVFAISPATGLSVNADSSLVSFFPQKTTTYTVTTNDECGMDTLVFTLYVSRGPAADFVFDPVAPRIEHLFLTLSNQSRNASSYAWFNSNDILESVAADYTFPNPGEGVHCYMLVAKDSIGCTDSVEKCADIINNGISHLFVPNAFTPGNDGINDVFRVRGLNVTFQLLSVFNRYGERIFMTTNMDEGWDGMYKGHHCDPGTYFYVVKYKERSGTARVKKGDVLLLR